MLISVTPETTCVALCLTKVAVHGSVLTPIEVIVFGVALHSTKLGLSGPQGAEICQSLGLLSHDERRDTGCLTCISSD